MFTKSRLLILCALIFVGCSSREMKKNNFTLPHKQTMKHLNENEKGIVIAGINNLNSQLSGIHSQGLSIGGLDRLNRYLEILRTSFKDESLILSTGKLSQEKSSTSQTQRVYESLNQTPIQFFGLSYQEVKSIYQQDNEESWKKLNWINSNIFEISTQQLLQNESILPHRIYQTNGLKIAILSVTPTSEDKMIQGLYFQDTAAALLKAQKQLKAQGVDVIGLISHLPHQCETQNPQFEDERELVCHEDSNLSRLIRRLPNNRPDFILNTGETFAFGKIEDTYVINTPGNGLYIGLLSLVYDTEKKQIVHNKTTQFGPILLCDEFYNLTDDCYIGHSKKRFEKIKDSNFKKTPAYFLGEPIKDR